MTRHSAQEKSQAAIFIRPAQDCLHRLRETGEQQLRWRGVENSKDQRDHPNCGQRKRVELASETRITRNGSNKTIFGSDNQVRVRNNTRIMAVLLRSKSRKLATSCLQSLTSPGPARGSRSSQEPPAPRQHIGIFEQLVRKRAKKFPHRL